jgi:hypothetical protein
MCPFYVNTPYSITGDCSNTGSGAFTIEIVGNSDPYTIQWLTPSATTVYLSAGVTAFTQTNLTAGTYSFTVTNTCIPTPETTTVTLYISSGTCVSITDTSDTTCSNDNGSLEASTQYIHGAITFQLYDFDTNSLISTQTFPTPLTNTCEFNSLSAGTYYVIADDGGGCTGRSQSCIIKDSSGFSCDLYVINNAGCNGTNAGAVYVTNLDGVPPYTFLWSNGETTQNITGLTNGIYTVSVTDSLGCTISETASVIDVPQLGLGTFITVPPTCLSSDGEVTVIVTGGTAPYYFSGSNGDSEVTFSTSYTFTGVSAGAFIVEVKDAGLCSFTESTTLINPSGIALVSIETTPSTCSISNGTICATLLTGLNPISYTLTNSIGGSETILGGSSYCFTNLESDTYILSISGGTCSYTSSPIVLQNIPLINITYNVTGTTCDECNGAIEIMASGSTAPYTYDLTGQLSVTGSFTSYTYTNLCSGNYTAAVSAGKIPCKVFENILIPSSPTVEFSLYSTNPTAYSNNGTISTIITNGTPPFTLDWTPNVGSGLILSGLSAGTYSLTITDDNDCVNTQTVTLFGYKPLSNYQLYPICNTDFTNSGLLLTKGIKQMLNEGFYDLTNDDTNCILNQSIFTAVVTVNGGSPTYEQFYTGTTLNDYPTDQEWIETIEDMLSTYGVTGVTYDIKLNTIKVTTPCNTLSGANIKVDLLISYDISCVSCFGTTPTPTPTQTPTNTPTPTPTPTSSGTPPSCDMEGYAFAIT